MVKKHVPILGGGFAGLACAQRLTDERFRVTLVDRWNHHLFQPLLYQVATAGLTMAEVAQPLRGILSAQKNVTTLMDEVTRIDLPARQVHLKEHVLDYDYLVIGLRAKTGYFGHHEWEQHTLGLKSLKDAMNIRRKVLLAFERAESVAAPETKSYLRLPLDLVGIKGRIYSLVWSKRAAENRFWVAKGVELFASLFRFG
jgi:NADH:ubiquinone reductase (H+-translocating)